MKEKRRDGFDDGRRLRLRRFFAATPSRLGDLGKSPIRPPAARSLVPPSTSWIVPVTTKKKSLSSLGGSPDFSRGELGGLSV